MAEKHEIISKDLGGLRAPPVLLDYDRARHEFTWAAARARLDGLPGGAGLNIAHEAVDRHLQGAADRVALRWLGKGGTRREISYRLLSEQSSRFAHVLERLGVGAGERVFLLLSRVPELPIALLGALKNRSVVCPLFSAFGPEPIRQRMSIGEGVVIVTTRAFYEKKVAPIRDQLPALRHILFVDPVGASPEASLPPGARHLGPLLEEAPTSWVIPPTDPEDPALLHFTSGTTGKPKGALHVHGAMVHHHLSGAYALDLRPGDVYWCTADPGWVTGTSYGILSPLSHGATLVVYEDEFDPVGWYGVLEKEGVDIWYTAPTAVRMMMKAGLELAHGFRPPRLRFIASVGEPLNPEGVRWGLQAFGLPIHDNWWQTETGGIMIANYACAEIRPGSMGRPLPGIEAAIVRRLPSGGVELLGPDEQGELALRRGWPSMFRTYLGEEERYRACFSGEWYLSGDLARRDPEGWYWFIGRAPGRALRGRERADGAPGRRRGRRHRQARPLDHGGDQGLRLPQGGLRAERRLTPRAPGSLPEAARRRGGPEGDRLPPQPAEDPQREDHAPPAQGDGARPAPR
jgi:acetyl-CoA synthetase